MKKKRTGFDGGNSRQRRIARRKKEREVEVSEVAEESTASVDEKQTNEGELE